MTSRRANVVVGIVAFVLTFVCVLVAVGPQGVRPAAALQSPGEFWRLPYRATAQHNVAGGYGYNEGVSHHDANAFALDLQVPLGEYIMAIPQGVVIDRKSDSAVESQDVV